jgi:NAD(P)-dependent dehydrogenase (short-subunit alcohol dehydrogenase family)
MNNLFELNNEVVIITGASGQMGLHYVKLFLNQNSKVFAIDLADSYVDKKVNENTNFLYFKCDVTNPENLILALDFCKNYLGSPTALINNAAIDSPPSSSGLNTGYLNDYPKETWEKVLDVNISGTFYPCQIFGSEMEKNKYGTIINISSIYGLVSPDQSIYDYKRKNGEVFFKPIAYSASKSAIMNLTRYLAVYWAKVNVRVNTLVLSGIYNNQEKEFLDSYNKRIPIGRMASPEDFDGALVFLVSKSSAYMTGTNLIIDGGWTSI